MAIIGHEAILSDFQKRIHTDRLGHGYIFFGPSMTGKATIAQAIGKLLEKGGCEKPYKDEVLQDMMVIDRAFMRSLNKDARGDSIGIDAVREAKHFLWQRPNVSVRRTLVINEADTLTLEAQNALLKITEEPPASSLLLFITSDIDSILPTITSRLPRVHFGLVPKETIAEWLNASKEITKAAAAKYAMRAMGKPGLAWRLAHDESFQNALSQAEQFLKTTPATRKEFIKKLIEPDDFNLRRFLDALITVIAWQSPTPQKAVFWHKALRLAENSGRAALNPRLQLEALMR